MLRGYRLAIIALGLTLFAFSGQAEEEAQAEQGETTQQESPSKTLPIPLPVHIVEDQAAADARERREEEARQREIADVDAQVGMDESTRAMNVATQDMRNYALYSTIFVGIGTLLLFVTLFLTRQANKAAQEAVDVTKTSAEKQLRAYISVYVTELYRQGGTPGLKFELRTNILNTGQTPAYDVRVISAAVPFPHPIPPDTDFPPLLVDGQGGPQSRMMLGPQQSRFTQSIVQQRLSREELRRLCKFQDRLYVFGTVRYRDAFGKDRYTNFCHSIIIQRKPLFIANAADRHNDAN